MEENNANKTVQTKTPIDNSAENTLSVIANIVLVCGIIATVICLFTIVFVDNPDYLGLDFQSERIFNVEGFVSTFMILFSSVISWSLLKVVANISITLKEINNKTK